MSRHRNKLIRAIRVQERSKLLESGLACAANIFILLVQMQKQAHEVGLDLHDTIKIGESSKSFKRTCSANGSFEGPSPNRERFPNNRIAAARTWGWKEAEMSDNWECSSLLPINNEHLIIISEISNSCKSEPWLSRSRGECGEPCWARLHERCPLRPVWNMSS